MKSKHILGTILLIVLTSQAISQNKVWSLSECIDTGWVNNLSIKRAELDLISADNDLKYNKAQYYPNLNGHINNGFNWGRSIDLTNYQFVNGLVNTNNIGLTGSITLFDGFTTPSRIKQSKVGVNLAYGQLQAQKNFIAISIASAYLQTLLAYERLEFASNQLSVSRYLLFITNKYLEKGLKSEGEVLQIVAQVASEESDSILAHNTLILAKLSLMQLIELPYSEDFRLDRFNPEIIQKFIPIPSVQTIYESALIVVPEILNAQLNIEISEYGLNAVKGNYYPKLSANGNFGTNYASSSKIVSQEILIQETPIGYLVSDPSQIVVGNEIMVNQTTSDYGYFSQLDDNLNGSVNINLTIPIYNRNQVKISEQKAEINISKAKLELFNQKNLLRKDIETDYLEYTLLSNQLKAGKKMLMAYKDSYKKTQKQFELQLTNSFELLIEKNKVSLAESEVVQLQYQQLFKYLILRYYITGEVELPID